MSGSQLLLYYHLRTGLPKVRTGAHVGVQPTDILLDVARRTLVKTMGVNPRPLILWSLEQPVEWADRKSLLKYTNPVTQDGLSEIEDELFHSGFELTLGVQEPLTTSHPGHRGNHEYDNRILCHRPDEARSSIPVTLLVRAFGTFFDNVRKIEPEPEDFEFAKAWRKVILDTTHKDERTMMKELSDVCGKNAVNISIPDPSQNSQNKTDGDTDGAMRLLMVNNGSSDSDAYLQGIWCKVFSLIEDYERGHLRGLHPSAIVVVTGAYVGVFGAAFTHKLVVDSLCSPGNFLFHPMHQGSWLDLARLVKALKALDSDLRTEGNEFPIPLDRGGGGFASTNAAAFALPYTTTITLGDQGIKISPSERMDGAQLVFRATINLDGKETPVVAKYMQQYSKEAHSACHKLGFAPQLLGSTQLPGGWELIVIERLDERNWEPLSSTNRPSSDQIDLAPEKLKRFHDSKWVHGDVRDANMMVYRGKTPDKYDGICLIDFEWSGIEKEVKYPWDIVTTRIPRAKGVAADTPILAAHDEEIFCKILGLPPLRGRGASS
ncbi:hypothetical protein FRC17_009806 [Serendipita sp. 399]|nr:hypothetical protein FRC17_009806 [Serendipita sp. 399]